MFNKKKPTTSNEPDLFGTDVLMCCFEDLVHEINILVTTTVHTKIETFKDKDQLAKYTTSIINRLNSLKTDVPNVRILFERQHYAIGNIYKSVGFLKKLDKRSSKTELNDYELVIDDDVYILRGLKKPETSEPRTSYIKRKNNTRYRYRSSYKLSDNKEDELRKGSVYKFSEDETKLTIGQQEFHILPLNELIADNYEYRVKGASDLCALNAMFAKVYYNNIYKPETNVELHSCVNQLALLIQFFSNQKSQIQSVNDDPIEPFKDLLATTITKQIHPIFHYLAFVFVYCRHIAKHSNLLDIYSPFGHLRKKQYDLEELTMRQNDPLDPELENITVKELLLITKYPDYRYQTNLGWIDPDSLHDFMKDYIEKCKLKTVDDMKKFDDVYFQIIDRLRENEGTYIDTTIDFNSGQIATLPKITEANTFIYGSLIIVIHIYADNKLDNILWNGVTNDNRNKESMIVEKAVSILEEYRSILKHYKNDFKHYQDWFLLPVNQNEQRLYKEVFDHVRFPLMWIEKQQGFTVKTQDTDYQFSPKNAQFQMLYEPDKIRECFEAFKSLWVDNSRYVNKIYIHDQRLHTSRDSHLVYLTKVAIRLNNRTINYYVAIDDDKFKDNMRPLTANHEFGDITVYDHSDSMDGLMNRIDSINSRKDKSKLAYVPILGAGRVIAILTTIIVLIVIIVVAIHFVNQYTKKRPCQKYKPIV